MDEETKLRIIDYFDVGDLVQLIGLSVADIVEMFPESIEYYLDDLESIMEYYRGR